MPRREFIEHSAVVAMAVTGTARAAEAQKGGGAARTRPEFYELRTIQLRIGPQPKIVHDYLSEAYLPACNRLGIKTVGVFDLMFGSGIPTIYVLTPHESLASFGALPDRLAADTAYQKSPATHAFVNAPAALPAYVRMESTLMAAFESLPRLEAPRKEPRIFELRTYESPSEAGHLKKMEMFTPKLGELEIFRRVGLTPVFFGRTLVGRRLPSFTYLLTYPDLNARTKAWADFMASPDWLKLKATPGYADTDTMNNINDLFLRPTAYSQI